MYPLPPPYLLCSTTKGTKNPTERSGSHGTFRGSREVGSNFLWLLVAEGFISWCWLLESEDRWVGICTHREGRRCELFEGGLREGGRGKVNVIDDVGWSHLCV